MIIKGKFNQVEVIFNCKGKYYNGQPAITCTLPSGEPYATLTTCIEGAVLGSGETILDTNNNPTVVCDLAAAGLIDTIKGTISSGFCTYRVVKVLEELL
tara:strand:+ start:100 stop:396 length:297 start_codon:yes stop_codon:yes gene_type:complete